MATFILHSISLWYISLVFGLVVQKKKKLTSITATLNVSYFPNLYQERSSKKCGVSRL